MFNKIQDTITKYGLIGMVEMFSFKVKRFTDSPPLNKTAEIDSLLKLNDLIRKTLEVARDMSKK